MPANIIAASLALLAFATAIMAGLIVNNPTETILARALLVMVGAWPVGWVLGQVGHRAIREHVERYKAEHPIEADEDHSADAGDADRAAHETPSGPAAAMRDARGAGAAQPSTPTPSTAATDSRTEQAQGAAA